MVPRGDVAVEMQQEYEVKRLTSFYVLISGNSLREIENKRN